VACSLLRLSLCGDVGVTNELVQHMRHLDLLGLLFGWMIRDVPLAKQLFLKLQ